MNRRTNLWSLIAAHVVCTALGLWMQQRYTAKEVESALTRSGAVIESSEAKAAALALEPSMLGIRAVTFLWMNGILGMIVYMVVTRVHDEFGRRGGQPAVEALRRTTDLVRTQDAVIFGLAKLADSRDHATGGHLERISFYCTILATALQRRGLFRGVITPAFVQHIGTSSALHDIGKVGIEDAILLKPGPLTPQEHRRIQMHARIGEECLKDIERRLGSSNFLRMAREIAAAHHERWDGTGYPAGLMGEEIPLAARIVAIADVYDALATRRIYKAAASHRECVEILRGEAGRQFDPQLVEVFLEIEPAFENVARQLGARQESATDRIFSQIDHDLAAAAHVQSELTPEKLLEPALEKE
jgi:HD-GYP domain-containing protein (c-di-GMP phosphodiesterase class II)